MRIYHPKKLDKIDHISKDGRIYQLDSLWKMSKIRDQLAKNNHVTNIDEPIDSQVFKSFHTNEFVAALMLGKNRMEVIESCGVFWQPHLPVAMFNRAKCVLLALGDLLGNKTAAAALVDGGHHTTPHKAYGFGPINPVGIALGHKRSSLKEKKVVVLDLDVHQGNGFSFIDMDNVVVFDIWSKRLKKWETNFNNKKYHSMKVTSYREWQFAFSKVLGLIKRLSPDILIYYSGADVISTDRMGGIPGFSLSKFKRREDRLFDFVIKHNIKLLLTLGGGYVDYSSNSPELGRKKLVDNHLYTVKSALERLG